jgi:hypothetical protein
MLATSRTPYGPNLLARLLAAKSGQYIEDCAKAAWVLNGEGLIDDAGMAYLVPVIEHQREVTGAAQSSKSRSAARWAPHSRPAIPPATRKASWLRRRSLAKDCVIPTFLAKLFTVSKLAVLAVIAGAVIDDGCSNMSLPEIAARAGVGCTTARYAIREASRMGLISVQENRCNTNWNRPNTIRIIAKRWLDWLNGHRKARARKTSNNHSPETPRSTPLRNRIPTVEKNRLELGNVPPRPASAHADPPVVDLGSDPRLEL